MPLGLSPSEMHDFGLAMRDAAREKRPADVNEEEPASVKAFRGDYWQDANAPQISTTVNIVYAAFKSVVPQVLAHTPKPAATAVLADPQYAELHNRLKEYRDREYPSRRIYRRWFLDAFLRGTGFLRHDWDARRGLARTQYMPARRVFIDHHALTLQEAKHVIEEHEVYRWEFARKFGEEVAEQIPIEKAASAGSTRVPQKYDRIKYYLLWSKHEDTRRVYAFHEQYSTTHLIESPDGPGAPFPYTFDDDEWHLTPLTLQALPDDVWGMSYYQTAAGPIKFIQFATSYLLAAAKKSAEQALLFPREWHQVIQKLQNAREHLVAIPYDADLLAGRSVDDIVKFIEYPTLPKSLLQAMELGWSVHDKVTGFNTIVQGDPARVETASESMRLSEYAEVRVGDDRKTIEEQLQLAWRKEIQIDGRYMTRQSVLRVNGQLRPDVPYQQAVLLKRGVRDPAMAQEQIQASQSAQQALQLSGQEPSQPAPLEPELEARLQANVGLSDPVEIVQPGVEAFVGPELAQYWIENLSEEELRSEIQLRIEQGSTRRLSRIQEVNEAHQLFRELAPLYQQFGLYDRLARLINMLLARHESFQLDALRVSEEELMAVLQQQAQAQQEAGPPPEPENGRSRERNIVRQAWDQMRQAAGATGGLGQ